MARRGSRTVFIWPRYRELTKKVNDFNRNEVFGRDSLTRVGIEATDGDKMKDIAERYNINPIDILKVILVDGFEL